MKPLMHSRTQQSGAALMAALFLITVVAALGVFALRLQSSQQQISNLQVLEYRMLSAAQVGIEFWSRRAISNPCNTGAGSSQTLTLNNFGAEFQDIIVATRCTQLAPGVYEISSSAWRGNFASTDYVRRTLVKQISTNGAGSF